MADRNTRALKANGPVEGMVSRLFRKDAKRTSTQLILIDLHIFTELHIITQFRMYDIILHDFPGSLPGISRFKTLQKMVARRINLQVMPKMSRSRPCTASN